MVSFSSRTYTLILLSLLNIVKAADEDYDATTTVTTTPIEQQTTTVGLQEDVYGTEYIFTDTNGILTTTTVYGTTEYGPYTLTPASESSSSSTIAQDETSAQSTQADAETSANQSDSASTSATATATTTTSKSSSEAPSITAASTVTDDADEEEKSKSLVATTRVGNPYFTEIKINVPSGVYSTSTLYSETVLDSGKTAVLELVVLHTSAC
ncbi:hypothetical protein K6H09_001359 [Candida tropicalis]